MTEDFPTFLQRREAASVDYISGDPAGVAAMLTEHEPSSFLPPSGAVITGPEPVHRAHVDGAQAFDGPAVGRFEIVASGSDGRLGYWTGRQHATVRLAGRPDPVDMVLRTTEVFRLEDDRWRLVHRHADMIDPGGA